MSAKLSLFLCTAVLFTIVGCGSTGNKALAPGSVSQNVYVNSSNSDLQRPQSSTETTVTTTSPTINQVPKSGTTSQDTEKSKGPSKVKQAPAPQPGPSSPETSPVPIIEYPKNHETVPYFRTTFVQWSLVQGASYDVEVTTPAGKVLNYSVTSNAEFAIPPNDIQNAWGQFNIRVAAITPKGKFWSKPVSYSNVLEGDNRFEIDSPTLDGIVPHRDLTIKWDHNAGDYVHIHFEDLTHSPHIIDTYLDKENTSFTVPGSELIEGDCYKLVLTATNSTDSHDPNYFAFFPDNFSSNNEFIYVHTLTPLAILYPKDGSTVPKGDLTVQWEKVNWSDPSATNLVWYVLTVEDLDTNGMVEIDGRGNINGSELVAGHKYRITLDVRLNDYDSIPGNRQITYSTFTVN